MPASEDAAAGGSSSSAPAPDQSHAAAGASSASENRTHRVRTTSGETYAQIAARQLAQYAADDIDRMGHLDELDQLRTYEGIMHGHSWPTRSGPTGMRGPALWDYLEAQQGEAEAVHAAAVESGSDIIGNGSLAGPSNAGRRSAAMRDSRPSGSGHAQSGIASTRPTEAEELERIRRLQARLASFDPPYPRMEDLEDDEADEDDEEDSEVEEENTDDPAPWRSMYTHGNDPLSEAEGARVRRPLIRPSGGGRMTTSLARRIGEIDRERRSARAEETGETVDEVAMGEFREGVMVGRAAAEEEMASGLNRGGNNMRRRNMIYELIARGRRDRAAAAAQGTSDDVEMDNSEFVSRSSRTGLPPTNIEESQYSPIVRWTNSSTAAVGKTRRGSDGSDTGEAPPKRAKIARPDTITTTLHRPQYISYTTLPYATSLPSAFIKPARMSNLALTSYHPLGPVPAEEAPKAAPSPDARSAEDHSDPHPPTSWPLITFTSHPEPTRTDADAALLRTSTPIPLGVGVHYFEAKILDSGPEGFMSIGWVTDAVDTRRLVGWDKGSWGWHADDGRAFEGSGSGKVFGPLWGADRSVGDIVGAGIDFTTRQAFFTKNGKMINHVFSNLPLSGLHPAVGLRNPSESIAVNLLGPFEYPIHTHVLRVRDSLLSTIRSQAVNTIPSLNPPPEPVSPFATKPNTLIIEDIVPPSPDPEDPAEVERRKQMWKTQEEDERKARMERMRAAASMRPSRGAGMGSRGRGGRGRGGSASASASASSATSSGPNPYSAALEAGNLQAQQGEASSTFTAQTAPTASTVSTAITAPAPDESTSTDPSAPSEPSSSLTIPSNRTALALIMEHLANRGLDNVKAALSRDLAKRKLIPPPEGESGGGPTQLSQAAQFEFVINTFKGGEVMKLSDLAPFGEMLSSNGLGTRLKILSLAMEAMATADADPGAKSRGKKTVNEEKTEGDGEPASAIPGLAAAEGLSEGLMKRGRTLLAWSTTEKWTKVEKVLLKEAMGFVCGVGDRSVWEKRRDEWADELKYAMRASSGLATRSMLEQALLQSQATISILADGVDGMGAFVDQKTFLKGYGRREVKPKIGGKGKGKASEGQVGASGGE